MRIPLTGLATFWTIYDDEFPIAAMHPGFWTLILLEDDRLNYHWYRGMGEWYMALVCYWAALAFNFFWVRRWMVLNFNLLIGRPHPNDEQPPPLSNGLLPRWPKRVLMSVVRVYQRRRARSLADSSSGVIR